MDNPEQWKITPEERTKHNATFSQLNPVNGAMLSGEQAKAFFLKSGLPTPVLGQIWTLADLNKDGNLDQKEFSIACFLIKKVLTSPQGATVLPTVCPKSLQIDPIVITAPKITTPLISSAPLIAPVIQSTTPLISMPAVSATPLFPANFPTPVMTTQIPISGMPSVTPIATAPVLSTTLPTMTTSTPAFPPLSTTFASPPPTTNIAASVAAQPTLTGAVFTPLATIAAQSNL